jgi:hypothetical protein
MKTKTMTKSQAMCEWCAKCDNSIFEDYHDCIHFRNDGCTEVNQYVDLLSEKGLIEADIKTNYERLKDKIIMIYQKALDAQYEFNWIRLIDKKTVDEIIKIYDDYILYNSINKKGDTNIC